MQQKTKPSGEWLFRWADGDCDHDIAEYRTIDPTAHEMYLWNYHLACTSCKDWLEETTEKFTKEEHKMQNPYPEDMINWNAECKYWGEEPYTMEEFKSHCMHECYINDWNKVNPDFYIQA